jgi:hypothetical protein
MCNSYNNYIIRYLKRREDIVCVRSRTIIRCIYIYMHCATSRKVADSIPDGVIGMFHWYNPSGRTLWPWSNRNEYQEYFLGGKGGRCLGLTTLLSSCADCLEMWEPQTPGTLRACPGLCRDTFFIYIFINSKCSFYMLCRVRVWIRQSKPFQVHSFCRNNVKCNTTLLL